MLEVINVGKQYDGKDILKDINFSLNKEDKVGLIGSNGVGKSTLFKIISGQENPDSGTVKFDGNKLFIGYLPQEFKIEDENQTVLSYVKNYTGLGPIELRLNDLQKTMELDESNYKAVEEFCELQNKYIDADGYNLEYKLDQILNGLNLKINAKTTNIFELSGGQKNKILLAGVLLKGSDLVLLDEPTNNLDLNSIIWLENYLSSIKIPLLIISHDRKFLDKITNKTMEIDFFDRTIKEFPGNYTQYKNFKDNEFKSLSKKYLEQKEEIKTLKATVQAQKHWADIGSKQDVKDNDKFTRGYERNRSGNLNNKAKKIEKQIKRIELVEVPENLEKLRLRIKKGTVKGSNRISLNQLVCGYEKEFRTNPLTLTLDYGKKIAFVGKNGSGKSTILKTIVGDQKPLDGSFTIGTALKIGYIPQDTKENENLTVIDFILSKLRETNEEVDLDTSLLYTLLHQFNFSYEDRNKKMSELSPGQRTRLLLLIFSLKEINTLILDEPTNHLDIEALESLEEALEYFDGTVLFVSHDRTFIEKINPDKIIEVEDGCIREIKNYS